MHILVAICLLASTANGLSVHPVYVSDPPVTQPVFADIPKGLEGLTLYNSKGERVAQCDRTGDSFANCRMDKGVTFDDVMNAWVHAYRDIQK